MRITEMYENMLPPIASINVQQTDAQHHQLSHTLGPTGSAVDNRLFFDEEHLGVLQILGIFLLHTVEAAEIRIRNVFLGPTSLSTSILSP